MPVTVEYIVILTGLITYRKVRIARIHINRGYFILFDENGKELYVARRIGGTTAIVSGFIPYLSFGSMLRFLMPENKLYSVSDEKGLKEIECEVNIP